MDFRVLGVLEVWDGDTRVDVGGMRHRVVLAMLLLEAGRVVPLSRLTEAVYGEAPPSTGRTQVQICVSALRKLFPDAIETAPPGYRLTVGPDDVDLQRFEQGLRAARKAKDGGRTGEAVTAYRGAFSLWRGPALDGLDGDVLAAAASRLAERRTQALEDCLDLELALGRHRQVVDELAAAVGEFPLRERLRGQLMLALYRSGRQAEALQVYREGRRLLVDELGLEPGDELREIERTILTGEARQPSAKEGPQLLPTDIADFTGRAEQIAVIERELTAAKGPAVPVVVLAGRSGVGKTTLAVHAAHRLRGDFPDGQLFADLHGHAVRPEHVLQRFLRALGVPGEAMPQELDELAERYRDRLAGRRMLVVLDNAGSQEQVRPLLPGGASCGVLVTSQARLSGLPGAVNVAVGVFPPEQSTRLVSRIAGVERVDADPGAASELAALCGNLPLAMRLAGARLAARPHWTVRRLVDRLSDEARRLDELEHSGIGVRAGLSLAYGQLSDSARRLFRLLTVPQFRDFSGWVAAALLDQSLPDAQDLLDDLADAQLVEVAGDRYRFHDLVRIFARERLAAEEPVAAQRGALQRVFGALLFLVHVARRALGYHYILQPSPDATYRIAEADAAELVGEPVAWQELERATVLAAIEQAARTGMTALSWGLIVSGEPPITARVHLDEWIRVSEITLAAAVESGDKLSLAAMRFTVGHLRLQEHRDAEGRELLEQSVALFGEAGDEQAVATALEQLAFLSFRMGNVAAAEAVHARALEIYRRYGDRGGVSYILQNLAQIRTMEGDFETARAMLDEALDGSRASGRVRIQAQVLFRIGELHQQTGRPELATEPLRAALRLARERGDVSGQAYTQHALGVTLLLTGRLDEAGEALDEAETAARLADERYIGARITASQGELALARGDVEGARALLREAIAGFREIRALLKESEAQAILDGIADSPR